MLDKYDMLAMFVKSYGYRRGSKQKSFMEVRYTASQSERSKIIRGRKRVR